MKFLYQDGSFQAFCVQLLESWCSSVSAVLLLQTPWILRGRRSLQIATWMVGLALSLHPKQNGCINVKDATL
jgi:hypothetical protein